MAHRHVDQSRHQRRGPPSAACGSCPAGAGRGHGVARLANPVGPRAGWPGRRRAPAPPAPAPAARGYSHRRPGSAGPADRPCLRRPGGRRAASRCRRRPGAGRARSSRAGPVAGRRPPAHGGPAAGARPGPRPGHGSRWRGRVTRWCRGGAVRAAIRRRLGRRRWPRGDVTAVRRSCRPPSLRSQPPGGWPDRWHAWCRAPRLRKRRPPDVHARHRTAARRRPCAAASARRR